MALCGCAANTNGNENANSSDYDCSTLIVPDDLTEMLYMRILDITHQILHYLKKYFKRNCQTKQKQKLSVKFFSKCNYAIKIFACTSDKAYGPDVHGLIPVFSLSAYTDHSFMLSADE